MDGAVGPSYWLTSERLSSTGMIHTVKLLKKFSSSITNSLRLLLCANIIDSVEKVVGQFGWSFAMTKLSRDLWLVDPVQWTFPGPTSFYATIFATPGGKMWKPPPSPPPDLHFGKCLVISMKPYEHAWHAVHGDTTRSTNQSIKQSKRFIHVRRERIRGAWRYETKQAVPFQGYKNEI